MLTINSFHNRGQYVNYFLAADGRTMLMAIEREESIGELDLFVSFQQKFGVWTKPLNLGKQVNSGKADFAPFLAADEKTLYFQPNSALGNQPPPADAEPSRFVYDPADPTPTIGGRLLSLQAGYRDDSRLAQRPDVLAFTGPVLAHDLDVIGYPRVELTHTTDIPHADVFVRLSEVDGKGRSRNVSDGYVRLGQDRTEQLHIDLDGIAHRFKAGNRIRLLIAGGSHPRFARNLGTADPAHNASQMVRSTHTIAHGRGGISHVVLPAIPANSPEN